MPKQLTRKQLNEIVTIKCYNSESQMRRQDAISFYFEGARECEGSESERYFAIYCQLLDGETFCDGDNY